MNAKIFLYIAWIQALLAVIFSLYASEILKITPCVLCWYQRICMYPLALLLPIGILRKDTKIYTYIFPLSIIGFFIGLYHVLLQEGIISETIVPCTAGISCATKNLVLFGFFTIPLLSTIAFMVIILCMLLYKRNVQIIKK